LNGSWTTGGSRGARRGARTDAGTIRESLAAAPAEAEPLRRLQAFTRWVGAGRRLTQTGRITLTDARELVGLLGTGDVIDPQIGDRVFRTKSSEELRGITLVAEWAKASGLVRRTSGKLVAVKKQAGLLERPLELWARMFEAFPRLGEALCVSRRVRLHGEQRLTRQRSAGKRTVHLGELRSSLFRQGRHQVGELGAVLDGIRGSHPTTRGPQVR
jgi:hypothetical protein